MSRGRIRWITKAVMSGSRESGGILDPGASTPLMLETAHAASRSAVVRLRETAGRTSFHRVAHAQNGGRYVAPSRAHSGLRNGRTALAPAHTECLTPRCLRRGGRPIGRALSPPLELGLSRANGCEHHPREARPVGARGTP